MLSIRFTRDNIVDRRGKQLMGTIKDQQWKVLNGRCTGDERGAFTYENRGVRSTLDYAVVDVESEANMRVLASYGIVSDGHALLVVQM